jgi:hypothetical protein
MNMIVKTLSTIGILAASIGVAAAADTVVKRPDPSTIHFIDGLGDTLAAGTSHVLGHLYFHQDQEKISVEYRAAETPDPTATKIVMLCGDTGARIAIPVSQNYLGPLPACGSLSTLKFLAE